MLSQWPGKFRTGAVVSNVRTIPLEALTNAQKDQARLRDRLASGDLGCQPAPSAWLMDEPPNYAISEPGERGLITFRPEVYVNEIVVD